MRPAPGPTPPARRTTRSSPAPPTKDLFTVTSADGTSSTVTVNILGSNDAAVLSSATVALTETDAVLTASGSLSISDVDSAATFNAATLVGTYGSLSLDAAGAWTYTASSAHDAFVAGTTYQDLFTVTSADGTSSTVTVNILGTSEGPTVSAASASVSEEGLPGGSQDNAGTSDTTNSASATGTVAIDNLDGPIASVTLTAPTGALTSGGQTVTWSGAGTSTLTASANGETWPR